MGKKLFSLCMALVLCLGLLPVTALAANEATVYVGNVELTGSKEKTAYATTNADTGAVTTEGADENNYNIMWDGETLTLRNAAIKQAGVHNNESIAVYLASGNMNLVLVGKNTVEAPDSESVSSCGIHVGGNLTIRGQDNGSLSVSGGDSGGSSYGIYTKGSITINSGTVNAASGEAQRDSFGIFSESDNNLNNMTINGGTVTATAGNAVGNWWYSCGIKVEGSITITDGSVTAIGSHATGTEGTKYSMGMFGVNNVTISGGVVTCIGDIGNTVSCGIATDNKLEIKNATVKAEGGAASTQFSCGLYAAQTCSIGDSTVTATGGSADTGGSYGILSDSDASTVTINGNSVVRADMTGTEDVDGKPISGDTITLGS